MVAQSSAPEPPEPPPAIAPARDALRRHAGATPEEPFVFYRGERFHFRWWSYARAERELEPATAVAKAEARAPREMLAALAGADAAEQRLAATLGERLGRGAERDVWISWRPLELAPERIAALAALEGGWAIVREPLGPAASLPAETFAWARPTILVGGGAEVAALLDAFRRLAPRTFRERWLRRRLARLRAVTVDDGVVEPVRERLVALGAEARLVAFPDGQR